MSLYIALKIAHLIGVILFFGNVLVSFVWKFRADGSRDPIVIAYAQNLVTLTDRRFTLAGIALVLLGGVGMTTLSGLSILSTPWLLWSVALFLVSGVIANVFLEPLKIRQSRLTQTFQNGGEIPEEFWRLCRRYYFWGVIATVLTFVTFLLMVIKP